jgi:hypothetical protein
MALMLAELPSRYGAEGCQYLKTLLRIFRATRLADYGRLFERIMTEKISTKKNRSKRFTAKFSI